MLIVGRPWIDPARPPEPGWVRLRGDRIAALGTGIPPRPEPGEPERGSSGAVIVPGFTDAHVHLPQFHQRGVVAGDLLEWLERAILPAEARWSDPAHATDEATRALAGLLRAGTVRAGAFLTSHASAIDAAIAAAARIPVDLLAGVSLMDREARADLLQPEGTPPPLPSGSPPSPLPPDAGDAPDAPDAPDASRAAGASRLPGPPGDGVDARGAPPSRVRLSVNPRFAVACTEGMLAAAGRLAPAGSGRFVHTHLAEQPGECRRVAELFPGDPSYAAVYDRFGLLHDRTLLAHAIHLAEDEWRLLAARGCTVVHCPGANTFLGSGLFDLAAAERHGVPVALGSDVAAGPDVAMPRVARAMIEVATLRRLTVDPDARVPSPAEAWRTITTGNAARLGRTDAGRLEAGATADLLLLEPDQPLDEHVAGRLLHAWDDGWIVDRILAGRPVDASRLAAHVDVGA